MGGNVSDVPLAFRRCFKEIFLILLGCAPYACSMVMIDKVSTIPGSVIGISAICNALLGTPIGVVNLLLNVPLMIIATFFLGRKMLLYTIEALIGTSCLIDWWVPIFAPGISGNPFMLTVLGGLLMGIGSGMILLTGATLAGTTVVGRLLILKFPEMKLGNVLIVLDGIILCSGALLMHDAMALFYSAVYTVICMKVIDFILYVLPKYGG